jgi:hypothetical protein
MTCWKADSGERRLVSGILIDTEYFVGHMWTFMRFVLADSPEFCKW